LTLVFRLSVGELMSIVGAANLTNRLATRFRVPLDEKFK